MASNDPDLLPASTTKDLMIGGLEFLNTLGKGRSIVPDEYDQASKWEIWACYAYYKGKNTTKRKLGRVRCKSLSALNQICSNYDTHLYRTTSIPQA